MINDNKYTIRMIEIPGNTGSLTIGHLISK